MSTANSTPILGLHGRFDAYPTKIGQTEFLWFCFFVSLTILELPIFKPHTTLTDRPLVPSSAAAFRHVSGVVGYIANKDQRTCDAGWPEQLLSRCL